MKRLAIDVERYYHELDPDTRATLDDWLRTHRLDKLDLVELTIVGEGVLTGVTERWNEQTRTFERGMTTHLIPTPPPMAAFDWHGPDRDDIVAERRRARARQHLHDGGCCYGIDCCDGSA